METQWHTLRLGLERAALLKPPVPYQPLCPCSPVWSEKPSPGVTVFRTPGTREAAAPCPGNNSCRPGGNLLM